MEVRQKVTAGGTNPSSPVLAVPQNILDRIQPYVRKAGMPPTPPVRTAEIIVKTEQPAGPFNPPKLVPPSGEKVTEPVAAAKALSGGLDKVVKEQPKESLLAKSETTTSEERYSWVQDFILANPAMSVAKVRAAMLKKFGKALGSTIINDLLKNAREVSGVEPRKSMAQRAREMRPSPELKAPSAVVKPAPGKHVSPDEDLRTIVGLMKRSGYSSISLVGNEVHVQKTQVQNLSYNVS
jgi:hypothetical protein